VDLLQDDRCLGDAHANATIGLGNERRQVAGRRHRLDKLGRKGFILIQLSPIFVRIAGAKLAHALAQIVM
jgi:hypothetical protein